MSTRTIIEINHDLLGALERNPKYLASLPSSLAAGFVAAQLNAAGEFELLPGVRVLAQRHHSESIKLVRGGADDSGALWPGLRPMGTEEPKA